MKSKIKILDELTIFDIETNTETNEIICIGLYSAHFKEIFNNFDSFIDFIIKKQIKQLYAYYGGGFDFLLLINHFRHNKKFKLIDIIEISGLIMYLKINYFGIEIEFIDAFGIFRGFSLNEVCENLLGRKKIDIDRIHLQDYDIKLVHEYCINDCELLFNALLVFSGHLGFLDITISKIAMKNFIDKHCSHSKKDFIRYNKTQHDIFGKFYFGGHVDVFKRYGENLNYYDINSSYANTMHKLGAIYKFNFYCDKFADTETQKGLYIINVEDDLNIPVIPKRFKEKAYDKIYFLNTRQDLYCTSIDLNLLDELNVKYKVKQGFIFDYDVDFFKSFINYWYEQRQKNKQLKFIAKLMMNSLYGKFGQKVTRLNTVIRDDLEDKYYYDKELNLARIEETQINWFNQPQLAAWVTSGARYFHSKLLNQYQSNLYYADTDSLIVDCEIDSKIINSDIGNLKLEYKLIEKGYFLAPKFYGLFNSKNPLALNDNSIFKSIVLKGFEFKQDLTEQHFKNALSKNDFSFEYNKKTIQKFKRSLISANEYITFLDAKKKIDTVSIKRKLKSDLINTEPYFLTNSNQLI